MNCSSCKRFNSSQEAVTCLSTAVLIGGMSIKFPSFCLIMVIVVDFKVEHRVFECFFNIILAFGLSQVSELPK